MRYERLQEQRDAKIVKFDGIDRFIAELAGRNELLTELDDNLWLTIVDTVMVGNPEYWSSSKTDAY